MSYNLKIDLDYINIKMCVLMKTSVSYILFFVCLFV